MCEEQMPDGDWRALLDGMEKLPGKPNLIVASRLDDDRLWSEVLNLGAYDLLMTPFEADEVRRVVSLAWQSKCREWDAGKTASRKKVRSETGSLAGLRTRSAGA